MIKMTFRCRVCGSVNVVRNGSNECGSPRYHCHDCNTYRVIKPKGRHTYSTSFEEMVLRAYEERVSLRDLERIFDVCRQTVARWIEEKVRSLPPLKATLEAARSDDVLESDESWSFVQKEDEKRWLWTAICRRTGQIVAFVIGERSDETRRRLWSKIPEGYRACQSYSDFWDAYRRVFPSATHRGVGEGSGETAHMERRYNTLRRRLARYVRKTPSFSKSDAYHDMVTKWYIAEYNLGAP